MQILQEVSQGNRFDVIENYAQLERKAEIATNRLNWSWDLFSENLAYGRH